MNNDNFKNIEFNVIEDDSRTLKIIKGNEYYIDFYNKVFINKTDENFIGYYDTELEIIQVLDEHMDF